ncbi:hypothetical protein GCM10009838_17970 [Catenulispora subtropica]|uniref:LamG-like jellyroll fold domain-containing protein n=1 Tax=Catenulispora subtropica TaxID=450798 RepID=A0ABP5CDK0_9ACTN
MPKSQSPDHHSTTTPPPAPPAAAAKASSAAAVAPDAPAAADRAKHTGKEVEVPSLTSETSRVLVKPDGTLHFESYVHPVRVQQKGAWTAVDTTLVRRSDGSVAPKAAAGTAVFSGGGSGPAVTLTHGDQRLDLSWPSALPAPVLEGPSATYPNVLPGVDLKLTATSDSYTEVLVVHDAQAAADPALKTIRLLATGTNLTVRANDDDTLSALDGAGKEVFRSSPATMWDSAIAPQGGDTPSATDPGSGHVTKVDVSAKPARTASAAAKTQDYDVALTVPGSALTGPAVRYPLFIDPWFTGGSAYWVTVSNKGYNTFNDSTQDARVGYCGWSTCNYDIQRTYFDMDVSGIAPRNGVKANLTSATFWATQTHDADCNSEPTDINESGWVDGNTRYPGPLGRQLDQQWSDGGGNSACSKNSAAVPFNIAGGVQDAINYGWTSLTLGLHADNENAALQWKRFANNPHLDIDYDFPPQGTTNLSVGGEFNCNGTNYVSNSTNFWVGAQSWDNNPSALPLKYWFEVWQASGSRMSWNWNYAPEQNPSGAYTWWPTNYGTFPNGNYSFRATVENVPQNDPAPPSWAYTGASGDSDANYSNSIANAGWHNFTVLNEAMPTPSVVSHDFQADLNNNPVWGAPQNTGGQFVLGNAGNGNTVGYSYAFDSGGTVNSVASNVCNYNSQSQSGGATYGLVSDSGGTAQLSLPAGLAVGHHTLYVKSFDAAHNMSANAQRYEFFISPNYNVSQTKFEAEDGKSVTLGASAPGTATAPTTAVQNWGNTALWSGGAQVIFTGHEVGDKYSMTFNTSLDADYALGIGLTKATDYGRLRIDVDGNVLAGTDGQPFDAYSPTVTSVLLNSGMRLGPGPHTLTLTVVGTNPATANSASKQQYQAGVDYIKAVPINNVTFSSFSAAMDDHGISDDSAPGAANLDYGSRSADGDVGGTTGTGYSLSKQAMAAAGLGTGTTFTTSGFTFTMPTANAAGNDNVVAMGQTITLDRSQQVPAAAVGLLVASTCGTTPQSTATVTYSATGPVADHPTTSPVGDWVSGTSQTAAYSPAYFNAAGGKVSSATRIYLLVLPADPGATLQSITLPNYGTTLVPGTCPTALHVLAVGVRPAASANASTSADISGGNHPLASKGYVGFAPDHGSSAATGGSAVFDGTGGDLRTAGPVLDTAKSFTVSAWVKLQAKPAGVWQTAVVQQGTNVGGYYLEYNPDVDRWSFDRSTTDVANAAGNGAQSQAAPTVGAWTHLVGVYDATAGTLALYVNGALQNTAAYTGAMPSTGIMAIGRGWWNGAAVNPWLGSISDVQVYQRALTTADATSLFTSPAPTASTTPAGVWPLSDFGRSWIGGWATVPTTGATASGGPLFNGQTIRQTVPLSTYGSGAGTPPDTKLRVRLGNRFDPSPVTVTTATAALAGGTGAGVRTVVPLTFGGVGNRSVTIQPGAEVLSDPIPVSALGGTGNLSVSLYLAAGAAAAPQSPQAAAVGYTAAGDQTAEATGASATWTPLATAAKGWYFLSGVDVTSTDTTQGTVAVLGDANSLSASGTAPSWVDDLPGALNTAGVASPGGVVDLSTATAGAAGAANSLGQRLHNWWRLSDGSGATGADLLGNSPLTMSGTTWSTSDHPTSTTGSAVFNGGAAAATSGPVIDTSQSFTISAWAKATQLPSGNSEVVATEGTTTSSFMIGYSAAAYTGSGNTWWVFMPSADMVNPGGTIIAAQSNAAQLNTWTHLTAVYDAAAGSIKLYVNGKLAASGQAHGFRAAGPLAVGRSIWNGTHGDYWSGDIADVEAFQQALPAGDVAILAAGAGADLQAGNLLNASALDEPNLRTVVLSLGAVDLAHGDTPAVVETNLQALVTDLKTGLKQYKSPNGDATVTVLIETVPSQGWASSDPRERARLTLNSDLLSGKIGAIDGVEDFAGAVAGAGSTDPATVAGAVATRFANDVADYAFSI